METIPEDVDEASSSMTHNGDGGTAETPPSVTVLRELYRSEKVERNQRTVPEERLRNMDPRRYDPQDLGPPEASSTSYAYSYESQLEKRPNGNVSPPQFVHGDDGIERSSTQLQKVTRVTKVTTTRTLEHIPIGGGAADNYANVYGDDAEYGSHSRQQQYQYVVDDGYATAAGDFQPTGVRYVPGAQDFVSSFSMPSAPGAPEIVEVDRTMVTLVWLQPDRDGDAGPVLGYLVELKHPDESDWHPAHSGLINDTQLTITNLETEGEYQFRVVASNEAGFGDASSPSSIVQLRPRYGEFPARRFAGEPLAVPSAPGRPQVVESDGTAVTLVWEPPIECGAGGPLVGYTVEYHPPGTDWLAANDYPVQDTHYTVRGLRPNGDYEFRVTAKNADGYGEPSQPTGMLRIKPAAPPRSPVSARGAKPVPPPKTGGPVAAGPPSQPQIADVDSTNVTLLWAPPPARGAAPVLGYRVEYREIGNPQWMAATDRIVTDTQFTVGGLRPNSTYEFRVMAKSFDAWSEPSELSEIVQLRPKIQAVGAVPVAGGPRGVPSQPDCPEVIAATPDGTVTLMWTPALSALPIQGYQLELCDLTLDPQQWNTVNQILTNDCKLAVSNLQPGNEYQFRIVAKNVIGYSEPSTPSQSVWIGVPPVAPPMVNGGPHLRGPPPPPRQRHGPANGAANYAPAMLQRDASYTGSELSPLPDEIKATRESPPISDTEDSPPPLRRNPPFFTGSDGVQWRDPTLPEVVEFLSHKNNVIRQNAAGYLQHLTYHDDANKAKTRELGGIPKLVDLLKSDAPEIQRNGCGDAGGIPALVKLLRRNPEMPVKEEVTGALWNLSSCDDLKKPILEQAAEPLINVVVVPYSGWSPSGQFTDFGAQNPTVFRNATGVIRNVSSASDEARRSLRQQAGLVEALLHFLHVSTDRQQVDNKSVENVVCVLRNLSYRCQEVEDPDYDKHPPPLVVQKGSPESPRVGKKEKSKKGGKKKAGEALSPMESARVGAPVTKGMGLLWQAEIVKQYLRVLQDSSNPETLEAAAGAIQNLAACYWQASIDIRSAVRKEKGLPILVELLSMQVDRVVCSVAGSLRNLAMDQRNKELIGKYAMRDLSLKLPAENVARDESVSDETIAAVLGVLYQIIVGSAEFAQSFLETGGVHKLVFLTRPAAEQRFSPRVVKYASQVLLTMWQHKEMHEQYRRAGFKESDFVSGKTALAGTGGGSTLGGLHGGGPSSNIGGRGAADTLGRPVSTQGGHAQTPTRLRPDLYDDYGSMRPQEQRRRGENGFAKNDHGGQLPSSTNGGSTRVPPQSSNGGVRLRNGNGHPQQRASSSSSSSPAGPVEPMYAQVNKQQRAAAARTSSLYASVQPNGGANGAPPRPAGDSWV